MYRISIDTGGTFTDTVLMDEDGRLWLGKGLTRDTAWAGIADGLSQIGEKIGRTPEEILKACNLFLYGTTRSTNAVLTGNIARTAFLTTEGFPDILVMREGGREDPYNLNIEYPKPYISREFTYEIPGRVRSDGTIIVALDEDRVRGVVKSAVSAGVEAVAVCLLWSVVNPEHEIRVGEIIQEIAPDLPYTLSHQINPIIREYRRGSSASIDASLKPLMSRHLSKLESDLREAGLKSDLLVFTSLGGLMHVDDIRQRPILTVKSGPSMAPVAARTVAATEGYSDHDVIVCDTGGTSFDVSLIPRGEIKYSRDGVLGKAFTGHMTGMSAVDIRSIGSGGGSIAWVDNGGLLRVGPQSAGAEPGPACYGRGGTSPTVTDAAVILGYLDAERFADGRMPLDIDAARNAFSTLGSRLGLSVEEAAAGVITVASEDMLGAIKNITISEGVDPRDCLLVAGGGAAGINVGQIARELEIARVLLPKTAGALSAAGGQHADILSEKTIAFATSTADFNRDGTAQVLATLKEHLETYGNEVVDRGAQGFNIQYWVEARYPGQVWEIDVPIDDIDIQSPDCVEQLEKVFHNTHLSIFAVNDPHQKVECVAWKARLIADLVKPAEVSGSDEGVKAPLSPQPTHSIKAYFKESGVIDIPRYSGITLKIGGTILGPAAVDEPTTTIVIPVGAQLTVTENGNYLMEFSQ